MSNQLIIIMIVELWTISSDVFTETTHVYLHEFWRCNSCCVSLVHFQLVIFSVYDASSCYDFCYLCNLRIFSREIQHHSSSVYGKKMDWGTLSGKMSYVNQMWTMLSNSKQLFLFELRVAISRFTTDSMIRILVAGWYFE